MGKKGRLGIKVCVAALLTIMVGCHQTVDHDAITGMVQSLEPNPTEVRPIFEPMGRYDPSIDMEAAAFISGQSQLPEGYTWNDNIWTQAYRDDLGINLDFQWVAEDYEEYERRINICLSSGDLPDFTWVPSGLFYELVESGMVANLTDAYQKYATKDLKNILESPYGRHMDFATFDGKLMGLPETYWPEPQYVWLRTDWMSEWEIETPNSMDEVIDFAREIKKHKGDTLGIPVAKNLSGLEGFFAAYGTYPLSNIWVKDASGRLVYGAVVPRVKAALSKLRDLYSEGLIDPDFGVKDQNAVYRDIAAGRYGLVYGPQWQPLWPLQDLRKIDPQADWKPIHLVTLSGGIARTGVTREPAFYIINKDYPHPEALIKMANLKVQYLESSRAQIQYHTDQETNTPIFKLSVLNITYPYRNMDIAKRFYTALSDGFDASGMRQCDKDVYEQVMEFYKGSSDPTAWAYARVFGPGSSNDLMSEIISRDWFQYNAYTDKANWMEVSHEKVLTKLKEEVFIKIIMGEEPIEAFDQYVKDWYRLGGKELTDKINKSMKN